MKGPSYREQNAIDWRVYKEILCRDAVASYKCELSRKERVDFGVLNEW